jgi:hypothetical protein
MTLDQHISEWWERRSYEQRDVIKAAAAEQSMGGDPVRLLIGVKGIIGGFDDLSNCK